MTDREKVIRDNAIRGLEISGEMVHLRKEHAKAILTLLKEQDDLLRKLQKDKDKLCLEVSEWKHKYHDRPLKEQEAVKPIAKEDDTYECICGAIVGWDELDASGIVQTRLNYCPFCGKKVKWEC